MLLYTIACCEKKARPGRRVFEFEVVVMAAKPKTKHKAKARLTNKQKAFVQEYLIDLNASAAARRAGYSVRTANRIASENLAKPHIQAAIQK